MRLRSMVLVNETGELKEKVSSRSARIKALTEQIEDLRGQLQSAQEKCRRQEKLVQTQAREISNLKVRQLFPRPGHAADTA
jgi:chromosome segregation ATPase